MGLIQGQRLLTLWSQMWRLIEGGAYSIKYGSLIIYSVGFPLFFQFSRGVLRLGQGFLVGRAGGWVASRVGS